MKTYLNDLKNFRTTSPTSTIIIAGTVSSLSGARAITSTRVASSPNFNYTNTESRPSTSRVLKHDFDAKTWLNLASEDLKELTCHERNQKLMELAIVEKEKCDKHALDFASEGIVCQ